MADSAGVRLYVGNLSFQATQEELMELFGQCGTVVSVSIVTDRDTGRSRGFAFVEMSNQQEAEAAIAKFNGVEVGGRVLTVNIAKPREARPQGGFNRGGGRGFGGGGRGFGGGRNDDRGGYNSNGGDSW